MTNLMNISPQALFGQLLLGLMNGSFYAILSLGLAVIFGLLRIINFTHGAQYMMGAFVAWLALTYLGVGYWYSLILAPLAVGVIGALCERLLISRLKEVDHLYGLLLTFALAQIIHGVFRNSFGASTVSFPVPELLARGIDFGFLVLPAYRAWVAGLNFVEDIHASHHKS